MMYRLLIPLLAVLMLWVHVAAQSHLHEDHDHDNDHDSDHIDTMAQDVHDHEGHDHGEEFTITLSPQAVTMAGIEIATAGRGAIATVIELPGEVGFDQDKLAHIAPRFPGIARKAHYNIGEFVQAGSTVAIVESNESMNTYEIKAPISGWVIDKHITPGEFVSGENSIFVLADLSTVWINLAVYPRDIDRVNKGHRVRIKAIGSPQMTTGTIDYITPLVDLRTRSATARVTLPNPQQKWRPGTFVTATIATPGRPETLIVEKQAVQYLDERPVVFVVDGPNTFKPVDVTIGDSDQEFVQILSGLPESARYVSTGAFDLKAQIVTSNMDPHAGHGH